MNGSDRLTRLEAAVCSLTKLLSGHQPIPLEHRPELAAICRERWPDMEGVPSLPRAERDSQ